jgi:putative ABC transport system ATP-binding protein
MIELDEVHKAYHQGGANELWAVRGVSLRIEPARITVLKGPSGSGKSTLLAMIGCLARPTSGRIRVGERLVSALPERFLTGVRRRTFGFVFQQCNLIPGLSVVDNVMLPAYPLAPAPTLLRRKARELLERFGLEKKERAKIDWLSGGEAQRVALCRALLNDPQVLIADEPTAHLDSRNAQSFLALVWELRAQGKTVLMSSHDPAVFDSPEVDRVIEMRDGLLAEGA